MSKSNEVVEKILNKINEYNEEIKSLDLESKKIEKEIDKLKDELKLQGFNIEDYTLITSEEYIYVDNKIAKEINNKTITKAVRLCTKNGKVIDKMLQRNYWKNDFIKSMIDKFESVKNKFQNKEQSASVVLSIKNIDLIINRLQSSMGNVYSK